MESFTNYLQILRKPEYNIFLYKLTVEPQITDARVIRRIMEHPAVQIRLNNVIPFLFGDLFYLPTKVSNFILFPIPHPEQQHLSTDPNAYLKISVKYLKLLPLRDQLVIFNCLFKNVSDMLNDDLMQTKYFDPKQPISLDEWFLEIWPGLAIDITLVEEDHDSKQQQLLLSCDTSHRVLHRANILDQIRLFAPNEKFKQLASRYIVGSYVTTRCGNGQQTYRIDAIDFESSPLSNCEWIGNGDATTTYFDYFKQHWGIVIKDLTQPLLVHKKLLPKSNMIRNMHLVPELCTSTGYRLMFGRSAVRKVSGLEPSSSAEENLRYHKLMKYIFTVLNHENASQLLADWGLTLLPSSFSTLSNAYPEKLTKTTATTSRARSALGHQVDSVSFGESLLKPVRMGSSWLVIFSREDQLYVDNFIALLRQNADLMSIKMAEPRTVMVAAGFDILISTENYLRAIEKSQSFCDRVIVIVTPGNVESPFFFHHIKRFCTLHLGVPLQFVRGSLLVQPRKLARLAPNLLMEMACKAGGVPRGIQMTLPAVMFIGIDVCYGHKKLRKRENDKTKSSVIGFVASLNSNATTWYSRAVIKENAENQENWSLYLFNESLGKIISKVLYKYKSINNRLPAYIFIYRKKDNNDIPLEKLVSFEYTLLERSIKNVYYLDAITNEPTNTCTKKGNFMPYIAFMTVTKGCSEKLYAQNNSVELYKADRRSSDISFDEFFLLPQKNNLSATCPIWVRHLRSGKYSCKAAIDLSFLQSLSYKLCHLFYHSKSVVRQPAPVVYAHRLAVFVTSFLESDTATEVDTKLKGKLFYI